MAVSTITQPMVVKDFSVTTTANPNVSPYGAYVLFDTGGLSGYNLTNAELMGVGSVNASATRPASDREVYIWTKSAGTFTLRCLFTK